MTKRCYIIGLTGGSGSGKSEAAKVLSELGAIIIDADKVAREVSDEPDTLAALKAELGCVVIDENGKFARKRLAPLAFSDREFMQKLTRITHRFITDRIIERIREIKKSEQRSIIVIDAPIPVKRGFLDQSDEIWVVTANHEVRLDRIMTRDRIGRVEAEARLNSQLKDPEYEELANRLIENSGSYSDLKEKLEAIWNCIV
jgi:dephospho-CoA kinase